MGKTSKWLRSLLSSKKSSAVEAAPPSKEKKKSKWDVSKSALNKLTNEDPLASPYIEGLDANKHAIAVAAATAAVAEAALAAAQAAAEVVRLTGGGGSGVNIPAYISTDRRRVAATIKIQSAFRAYLARRALRALKGLVKLQAMVRGRIVRKQSADMLRRMQAMARIQARASAHRAESSKSYIGSRPPGAVNARNYYQRLDNAKRATYISKQTQDFNRRSCTSTSVKKESSHLPSNWLNRWMEQYSWNNREAISHEEDERSDKILEIDTWKPHQATIPSEKASPSTRCFSSVNDIGREHSKVGSLSRRSAQIQKPNPSISSEEGDQAAVWTGESSPRVHSALSRASGNLRGPFTPAWSECSRSFSRDYISHPNYMANTESSQAKVRSRSAPKQRMRLDELGVSSVFRHDLWESDAVSEKGFGLAANNRGNKYLHSGYEKRHGTPIHRAPDGISSSYGYRL